MANQSNTISIDLGVRQYPSEGFLQNTYSPLRNLVWSKDDDNHNAGDIVSFTVNAGDLNIGLNPLFIECQPSYDGTVNLIINDDVNPPRLINTRFSKKENNTFKVINRNQIKQTNLYDQTSLDKQVRLIKNTNKFPIIDLLSVNDSGTLMGGNYTFYIRYIDGDFNESPIVSESGQISVFHGVDPSDISGTLSNELTSKSILLSIGNLDTSYNALKLYYVRSYSDLSGAKMVETKVLSNSYTFSSNRLTVEITGYEDTETITPEELNIKYLPIEHAKTQAQVQNMLFLGNLEKNTTLESDLQNLAYFIEVTLNQDDHVGFVQNNYDYVLDTEYYNPVNIYYKLGYWPDEYYRMGIVFIMNDDSLTPAFNLRGCSFQKIYDINSPNNRLDGASNLHAVSNIAIEYKDGVSIKRNDFITQDAFMINTFGVFKTPKDDLNPIINFDEKRVKPYYFNMTIPSAVLNKLHELNVKGYFFVRQKRIPTIFGQGVSFGIDETSYAPMLYSGNTNYIIESFLTEGDGRSRSWVDGNADEKSDTNITEGEQYSYRPMLKHNKDYLKSIITSTYRQSSCLISLDADISSSLQSYLNGTKFTIEGFKTGIIDGYNRSYRHSHGKHLSTKYEPRAIYVAEGTPYKFIENYGFSTKFGSQEEVKGLSFFGKRITNSYFDEDTSANGTVIMENVWKSDAVYGGNNRKIIRGIYTGIIGLDQSLEDGAIYNIKIPGYSLSKISDYFTIRKNDTSAFYAISNRYLILDQLGNDANIKVFRGDCFTNTVSIRLLKNFIDSDSPITDTIVDPYTWGKNYAGFMQMGEENKDGEKPTASWAKINKSDVNNVPLGMWFTYKCLSSNNLGLRAVDHSYPDEEALMGTARSFYPLSGMSTKSSNKVPDSKLLNLGYSSTVGEIYHLPAKDLPFQKELFDNRIAFSNIQVEDEFQNGYRVFQNLAYKDIDRQYGAIVKLLPWGTDLLCVFEHGIGIVPVNEKALIQTTTNQSIHMYGAGVLQSQISLITGDYGSVWQESIIRTPIGVYGVDTFAKKIWRYSEYKGFETISDMNIQRFLNDHILIEENSSTPLIGLRNIKSHYNNYKGDVMFTFYNFSKNEEWNLCFNERLGKWITRYSWTPVCSENINNIFYSFDKRRVEILSKINNIIGDSYGLRIEDKDGKPNCFYPSDKYTLSLTNNIEGAIFNTKIKSAKTSYLDEFGKEIHVDIPIDTGIFTIIPNEDYTKATLRVEKGNLELWWSRNFESKITNTICGKKSWEDEGGNTYFETTITEPDLCNCSGVSIDDFKVKTAQTDENGEFIWEKDAEGRDIIGQHKYDYVKDGENQLYYVVEEETETISEYNPPISIPFYIELNVVVNSFFGTSDSDEYAKNGVDREYTIALLVDKSELNDSDKEMYDKMFINGVYVHGRAGIFDEIDYTDDSLDNQILPTRWYDKQEPFEFEFVVNDPIGMHKVFENLIIISNNVAPKSIQFEIEGDSYSVWKSMNNGSMDKWINPTYNKNLKKEQYQNNTLFKNASVKWDTILNQYSILMTQECKSIEKFGRRFGNMHYKEDAWYITINPLLLLNKDGKVTSSTKLRDKYLKVRVRYSGEDLAVITAIKSMVNLSAS